MLDAVSFFAGMLLCGILLQAGELSNAHFEARRRQYVARIRGTKVPGLSLEGAVGGAQGGYQRPRGLDEPQRGHGAHAVEQPRVDTDRLLHSVECGA